MRYTHPVDNYYSILWKLFGKSPFFILHMVMFSALKREAGENPAQYPLL